MSADTFRRLLRAARPQAAAAIAGFALATFFFGMDDIERLGMWAQDRASALVDRPALAPSDADADADTDADVHGHSARTPFKSSLSAKVDKDAWPSPQAPPPVSPKSALPGPGDLRHWLIPFWIDPAGLPPQMPKERAIALISQAAASWRPCGARFSYQGQRSKPPYGSYGPGEDPSSYPPVVGWMSLPESVTGLTLTESDPATGQVERWTMDLDSDTSASAAELLSTATHEFGHVLGLSHARDIRSIMFGGPNPKTLRPSSLDLSECQRVLSTWSPQSAADMASPLASSPSGAR